MKVLNGISPISIQSTRYLINSLKKRGVDSDLIIYKKNPVLKGYEDQCLNIELQKFWKYPYYSLKICLFFIKALLKYKVFHFHFGHSLLPLNVDLFFIKLFGKKAFMEYHGSDIRRKSIFGKNKYVFDNQALEDQISFRKQKRISRYISGIIVHDAELAESLFDFGVPVHVLPLRLDLVAFQPVYPEKHNNPLLIIHSPTNESIKGTKFVIDAVNTLATKYPIEFKLLSGMHNQEVKEYFAKADIIIDQLIIGTYGMVSIEGMAFGKPTICYLRDELFIMQENKPPLYNANIYTIREKLEELIVNYKMRLDLGQMGRQFVERIHDSEKVAEQAIKIYES